MLEDVYKIITATKNIERIVSKTHETIPDALLKLGEESGELMGSYLALSSYKKGNVEEFIEEIADVIQATFKIAILTQKEFPELNILNKLLEKNKKWEDTLNKEEN